MQRPSTVARPTRRTLLAASAWSVPAIAVAAAAPAYATSTAQALTYSVTPTAEITTVGTKHFHGSLTVMNPNSFATSGLQISVGLPGGYATAAPTALVINSGAVGWTVPQAGPAGGLFTYVFTATTELAGRATAHVTFDMDLLGTLPSTLPAITVTASASNMGQVSVNAIPKLVVA